MPIKALIMEIKDEYALAMSDGGAIIRIKNKPGMNIGGKIYVLEEDIYRKESRKPVLFSPKSVQRLAAIAAMLILCVAIALIGFVRKPIYATASFGTKLDLELSKDGTVLRAKSEDRSISSEQLRGLEGRSFVDVVGELQNLIGVGEMRLTFTNKATTEEKTEFEKKVMDALPIEEPENTKPKSGMSESPVTKPSATEPSGKNPSAMQPGTTENTDNGKNESIKTPENADKIHTEAEEKAREEAEKASEEAEKAREEAEKAREEAEEKAKEESEKASEEAEKAREEEEKAREESEEKAKEEAEKAEEKNNP